MMLPDDDLDIDAEVVGVAEQFDHATDGMLAIFREFENLDVDDHAVEVISASNRNRRDADAVATAGLGRDLHAFGNVDPLANAVVMWDDVRATLANLKLADHSWMSAPQDFDDLTVGAAVALDAGNADHHAIAMHGGLRGVARNINVAAQPFDGMIGDHESISVAVHVQTANRVFAAQATEHVMAGLSLDQVAALLQAVERSVEIGARRAARG